MRTTTKRAIRLPVTLKLFENGKTTKCATFRKKTQAMAFAQVNSWHKAYLKVMYDKTFYSDGIYYNFHDLQNALAVFTEKALLNYVEREIL